MDYHAMTHQELTEFLDRQSHTKNQRISFNNRNESLNKEFMLPKEIDIEEVKFTWNIHQKGLKTTIIVSDITKKPLKIGEFEVAGVPMLNKQLADNIIKCIHENVLLKTSDKKKSIRSTYKKATSQPSILFIGNYNNDIMFKTHQEWKTIFPIKINTI